jgi:hypothetical protein
MPLTTMTAALGGSFFLSSCPLAAPKIARKTATQTSHTSRRKRMSINPFNNWLGLAKTGEIIFAGLRQIS